MRDDDKKKEGDIWLNRISNARSYESTYRRQAYSAYKLYNKNYEDEVLTYGMADKFGDIDKKIEKFSVRNNRSNIFYANIEALLSLVLPDIPNLKLYLKNEFNYGYNSPLQPTQAGQAKFYDLAIKVLEEATQHFVDKSLKKQVFKKFKLDHFITGRGILWVDYYTKSNGSNGQEKQTSNVCIDYVHWLNFAMDPKLEWSEVRWVARRMYLDKKKLKKLYPDTDFEDFHFTSNPYVTLQGDDSYVEIETTYLASGGKYAEIWEIWDKFTSKRIIISPQSEERLISVSDVEVDEKYFFPTPEPSLSICNGLDLRPTSEVWSYLNELKQLSFISIRKEQLLRSLLLKGFTSAMNSDALQKLNNSADGDIIAVNNFDPQFPNIINYVDNRPKVELLNILSQEHESLKNNIYEISGISDQMRNVSAMDDSPSDQQTATEIKTKTVFGSRRLREKQDNLLEYLKGIYEILLYRCCLTLNKDTLKEITNLNIDDSLSQQIEALLGQKTQIQQQLGQLQAQLQQLQQQAQAAQMQAGQMQQPAQQQQMPDQQPMSGEGGQNG